MNINIGDKFLCKKTHYDKKGVHVWQIGKYYEIHDINLYHPIMEEYSIETEIRNEQKLLYFNSTVYSSGLNFYFLVDERKIRKFKLLKLEKLIKIK